MWYRRQDGPLKQWPTKEDLWRKRMNCNNELKHPVASRCALVHGICIKSALRNLRPSQNWAPQLWPRSSNCDEQESGSRTWIDLRQCGWLITEVLCELVALLRMKHGLSSLRRTGITMSGMDASSKTRLRRIDSLIVLIEKGRHNNIGDTILIETLIASLETPRKMRNVRWHLLEKCGIDWGWECCTGWNLSNVDREFDLGSDCWEFSTWIRYWKKMKDWECALGLWGCVFYVKFVPGNMVRLSINAWNTGNMAWGCTMTRNREMVGKHTKNNTISTNSKMMDFKCLVLACSD